MVMECNNPDKIEQKCPDDMSFKEIIVELKTMATPESRLEWLILNLDFLFDYREEEIESLRRELRGANTELALLKQTQTDPVKTFRAYQGETPDGAISISERDQIIAYCAGMSEGIENILHYIEHTVNFENCEMV